MLLDELRSRLRSEPFRPFTVHLTDGTAVSIHHHDDAWVLPSGGELFVQDENAKVHIIDTSQIAQISSTATEAEQSPLA